MRVDSFVVDASVAVAVAFNEPISDAADRLFERAAEVGQQLLAPRFWLLECGNACLKRWRRKLVTHTEAITGFGHIQALDVKLVHIDELILSAVDVALLYELTTYDALYAMTAEYFGATLVSADAKLIGALRRNNWQGRALHVSEWTAE